MTLLFPLIVFVFQIFLAAWRGIFNELTQGFLISGGFLFFFYLTVFLFRCGAKESFFQTSEKVSSKELLKFSLLFVICLAIFADALRVMPNLDAIRLDQVASTRGELLEENNYWQPRVLGYLSVILTIFTIRRAGLGLKYNLFAIASIAVSLMNSTLTFARGYLLLNVFALLGLYSNGKSRKAALPFLVLGSAIFLGVEFARHGDNGMQALLETFSSYFLAPVVGISYLYRNNVSIPFECQSAIASAISSGCSGNLSQVVAQVESLGLTSNVYGMTGEWYAIGGVLTIPITGVIYGLAFKKNTTKRPLTWSSSIAYYLFSVFSIYYFFSDPFLTNGVFSALLLLVICAGLRNILARKSRLIKTRS